MWRLWWPFEICILNTFGGHLFGPWERPFLGLRDTADSASALFESIQIQCAILYPKIPSTVELIRLGYIINNNTHYGPWGNCGKSPPFNDHHDRFPTKMQPLFTCDVMLTSSRLPSLLLCAPPPSTAAAASPRGEETFMFYMSMALMMPKSYYYFGSIGNPINAAAQYFYILMDRSLTQLWIATS